MYAIVDIFGKQFRVEKGQEIKVPLADGEAGSNLQLDRVLLVGEDAETKIGRPVVDGAAVDATILSHGRERKIVVFKFKRRKGYKRTNGHRQDYTILRINDIKLGQAKAAKADSATQADAKPAAKKKPAAKAAAANKTTVKMKAGEKPASAKSSTKKKTAVKKSSKKPDKEA